MEITGSITVAGHLIGVFLKNQRLIMASETKPGHICSQLKLVVGPMGSVASKAAFLLYRPMHRLLFALIVMALVTNLSALVLDSIQLPVGLMVTAGSIVAGRALLARQTTMNEGSRHFTLMALVTWLSTDGINGSGLGC